MTTLRNDRRWRVKTVGQLLGLQRSGDLGKVYAKCMLGQHDKANQRIDDALGDRSDLPSKGSGRCRGPSPFLPRPAGTPSDSIRVYSGTGDIRVRSVASGCIWGSWNANSP